MLRLNVLSGTTVLTILGRRALRAAQLSPKIHSPPPTNTKPGMQRPEICRSDWISPKTASPHPLKSPMLRRKAGDDGGVQRTPSPRPNPKQTTEKNQKKKKEVLPV